MLNWMTRYAPVKTVLDNLGGGASLSILDVGCGPVGLSCALPDVRFAGCDVAFWSAPPSTMVAVQATPGSLPFLDRSFDVVVCLDVLEHVPPDARRAFVGELTRVAAGRVLLAVPTSEATWLDEHLRSEYELHGYVTPDWLDEHTEFGLPSPAEIDGWVQGLAGFTVRPWTMVNGWLAALIAFGDVMPALAGAAAREWDAQSTQWLGLLQAAEFGDGARKGISLERDLSSEALVDCAASVAGVVAAVRCGVCGASYSLVEAESAACTGCAAKLHTDQFGVWTTVPASA
jgi:SAM-dependent methyltransferase